MQCAVCSAFKRELSRVGENETVATLRQRALLVDPVADQSFQDLESEILISRKRRARIASELRAHNQHAHREGPEPGSFIRGWQSSIGVAGPQRASFSEPLKRNRASK